MKLSEMPKRLRDEVFMLEIERVLLEIQHGWNEEKRGLPDAERVVEAARCYLRRKERKEHPRGKFDDAGRWYPAWEEVQGCCWLVLPPSRSFPYRLLNHCRTARHVAALYDVDERELLRTARQLQRAGRN